MPPTKAVDKIFPITTFISDLPTSLIPRPLRSSSENGVASGRLIIVGDVHGMRKSLEALLDKVGFDKSKGDHLILVGDLVNKGPDSPGVVDLAIKLGASAVRGNHENAVLDAAAEIKATKDNILHPGGLTDSPTIPENREADLHAVRGFEISDKCVSDTTTGISMRHSAATYSTASVLSTRQLDWLAALPLILRVKLPHTPTSSLGDSLIVVHAGLVPDVSLEDQDPYALMHIRSLVRTSGDEDGFMPAEISGEESWVTEWNRWQDKLASKTTVVFGHDAKRRLQLSSAVVIAASDGEIEHQILQVECADVPVVPTVSVKQEDNPVVD
ncbi:unnamed protein product [Penicillium glandicola]